MDRLTVLAMFSWQYLLMAFLACLGIVQLAAARTDRRHLWLLRQRRSTALTGFFLLLAGMVIFYLVPLWVAGPWGPLDSIDGTVTWARAPAETLTGARNINDTAGGLSGHWQALSFAVAWVGAAFFARTVGRIRKPSEVATEKPGEPRVLVGTRSGGRR